VLGNLEDVPAGIKRNLPQRYLPHKVLLLDLNPLRNNLVHPDLLKGMKGVWV
jgi:hypothetical protein